MTNYITHNTLGDDLSKVCKGDLVWQKRIERHGGDQEQKELLEVEVAEFTSTLTSATPIEGWLRTTRNNQVRWEHPDVSKEVHRFLDERGYPRKWVIKIQNAGYSGASVNPDTMYPVKTSLAVEIGRLLETMRNPEKTSMSVMASTAPSSTTGKPMPSIAFLKQQAEQLRNSSLSGTYATPTTQSTVGTFEMMEDSQNHEEHQYLRLLEHILDAGVFKGDRTGVGCYSVYGEMMRFDLRGGKIPLLTTKQMGIKSIIHELLWFLNGDTNNTYLKDNNVYIWDEWALENGNLGPIYGKQWVSWEAPDLASLHEQVESIKDSIMNDYLAGREDIGDDVIRQLVALQETIRNPPKINQIKELITALKENPNSRRMLVTAWNPAVLPQDYRWEYNYLDPSAAAEATHVGWEPMTLDQRMDWLWENKGIGHGIFDEDILVEHRVPTHRRKVKVTPQDNVKNGRAALPACHTMLQVHAREMNTRERWDYAIEHVTNVAWEDWGKDFDDIEDEEDLGATFDAFGVPRYALTLQFYCRSQDTALGTPYNFASYGILAQMIAQCVGMVAEELIYMAGDMHIYKNQLEGVKVQLEREPKGWPTLKLNPEKRDIFGFTIEDFELVGYDHHPRINFGQVAV